MGLRGRIMTGARMRLLIDTRPVGYGRSISWREEEQNEEVRVIGNMRTEENVSVAYRVSGSVGMARIIGESVRTLGLWPFAGKTSDEHLLNILAQKQFTMVIEDPKTSRIVHLFEEVKFTGRSGSLDAVGISYENLDWVAIVMKDEAETAG